MVADLVSLIWMPSELPPTHPLNGSDFDNYWKPPFCQKWESSKPNLNISSVWLQRIVDSMIYKWELLMQSFAMVSFPIQFCPSSTNWRQNLHLILGIKCDSVIWIQLCNFAWIQIPGCLFLTGTNKVICSCQNLHRCDNFPLKASKFWMTARFRIQW